MLPLQRFHLPQADGIDKHLLSLTLVTSAGIYVGDEMPQRLITNDSDKVTGPLGSRPAPTVISLT
jgi:hypothetical protein